MGVKCERHFCSEKEPKTFQPDWMSKIPNNIPLSQLTIPGTHNSCSLYGGPIAITQSWSIANQLRAGILTAYILIIHDFVLLCKVIPHT